MEVGNPGYVGICMGAIMLIYYHIAEMLGMSTPEFIVGAGIITILFIMLILWILLI